MKLIDQSRWREVITTLAKLHTVNIDVVGLDSFGHRSGFYRRRLQDLKVSEQSQRGAVDINTHKPIGKVPGVEEMIQFFSDADYQPKSRASLIHGDFKIKNVIFHKTEPKVIGILKYVLLNSSITSLLDLSTDLRLAGNLPRSATRSQILRTFYNLGQYLKCLQLQLRLYHFRRGPQPELWDYLQSPTVSLGIAGWQDGTQKQR